MGKDGENIKFLPLKIPNPIRENVIGFLDVLPEEFDLHGYVDYKTQFQKSFIDPLIPVFEASGWSIKEKTSLRKFFKK